MPTLQDLLYASSEPQLVELPSGAIATVLEMTGADQRNFSDRTKIANGQAINELLERCVDTVDGEKPTKEQLLDMLSGDRKALMFNIRKFSIGDEFLFKSKCPACGEASDWELTLSESEFPVRPYKIPGGAKTVEAPSKILPGLTWKFQMLDGHAELKAIRLRNKATSMSDLDLRQIQASPEPGAPYSPVNLDKLSDKLIAELRATVKEYEGDLDDEVRLTCPKCAGEVTFHLMGVQDFLIPGATS